MGGVAQAQACNDLAFHALYGGCYCYTCCIRRKVRKRFNIEVSFDHPSFFFPQAAFTYMCIQLSSRLSSEREALRHGGNVTQKSGFWGDMYRVMHVETIVHMYTVAVVQ